MKERHRHKKICDSWYHQKWFRIVLVVVSVDMIFLGGAFAFGMDITNLIDMTHPLLRMIIGLAFILTAIYIIHHALSYQRFKREHYFVCTHCAGEIEEE